MAELQFVARERELARLQVLLDRALGNQSQVCFVTGDAGSGKTALVSEFTRRAQRANPDLLVAVGNCNAQTGLGDPYLPFREVFSQLFGDVEDKLAQKAISPENANRLQGFLVHSGEVLVEIAPDLVENLIPGYKLLATLARAKSFRKGSIEIKPRITCIDSTGHALYRTPEPVVVNVIGASLPGRLATGYSDLDNLLFGGLPEKYSVLLSSPSSDEREQLIKKFLETGLNNRQTTYFITSELGQICELVETYPTVFTLFLCNARADVMIKSLPNVNKLKGVESLTDIEIALIKTFRTLDPSNNAPKRACITILSDVLLQHHAVITRKWLGSLLQDLKSKGFTTLVVMDPQMHPSEEFQAIVGLFEGEIQISERETPMGLDKVLRVRKLYNQRYLENEIILTREKARAMAKKYGWMNKLEHLIRRKEAGLSQQTINQQHIFEQYTKTLKALAERRPLIVVLDDLQWADAASISLLFNLGRQMTHSRVLLIGCYRPTDVAMGRGGERHSLESVVNELTRYYGDIAVDLNAATVHEGRHFVDAVLDSQANLLGEGFRAQLFHRTGGHALFTIELLRDMETNGDLQQDERGRWIEGPSLDWGDLPIRVESVIQERLARLDKALREALTIASVEGVEFTAEVVARVQRVDLRGLVQRLSREASQTHRLVRERGVRQVEAQRVSLYYFWHSVFQAYLYNELGNVERVYLHEDVGRTLEELYSDQAEHVALQLAWHFEQAGVIDKAINYLCIAGNRAIRLSANEEAKRHFSRGLALLKSLPESPERAERELELQLPLAVALMNLRGYSDPEVGQAFAHAHELCNQIGETPRIAAALHGLGAFYFTRAEYITAVKLAKRIIRIASKADDPTLLLLIGHNGQVANLSILGDSNRALMHAKQVLDIYDPKKHLSMLFLFGHDIKSVTMSYTSINLWLRGYPDQARKMSRDTLTNARELAHPHSLAFTLYFANLLYHLCHDVQSLQELTQEWITLSTKYGFNMWIGISKIFWGWSLVEKGQKMEGIAEMQQGLEAYLATGAVAFQSNFFAMLAEAYGKVGKIQEGLSTLDKGIAYVKMTGERFYEAEIHRLKGELLLAQGSDEAGVEEQYDKAIDVARRQGVKSLELRAVTGLTRLWQKQGKREEGRRMLQEIYGWFTEGLDTVDLIEAKTLLEELANK
ncbi:TPA: AAA family ATPase [Candidatus Bathyarchaeota archaeon]|nr:AAA family ATPase [Candidatus Bathyarchaeota archaeon]